MRCKCLAYVPSLPGGPPANAITPFDPTLQQSISSATNVASSISVRSSGSIFLPGVASTDDLPSYCVDAKRSDRSTSPLSCRFKYSVTSPLRMRISASISSSTIRTSNATWFVEVSFKPATKGPSGEGVTNIRLGLHSDALNLMLVCKHIHDMVKSVLYGTNHFDFHSSESIRELKSLGGVGLKGVIFLRDITVALENSTAANRIVPDLSASPLLRKLVIVQERINKCIFSKGGYRVSRLALIDNLHTSRQATPWIYKLQDSVSLKECHCKTCDTTSQGKACCELPACATAHTLFEQKMRELIEAKYGADA